MSREIVTYAELVECEGRVLEAEMALERHKRFLRSLGWEEHPFAFCCAEGGGSIEGCDCVNKNHGSAFHQITEKKL